MPVRRGHVAPRTTIIETIIRKFDTHSELQFLLGFPSSSIDCITADVKMERIWEEFAWRI
jgi:hypothetical protein